MADVTDKAVPWFGADPARFRPADPMEQNDMCPKISATRRRSAGWLLATVVPALVVNAGSAYLPITGPTPLRLEVMRPRPVVAGAVTLWVSHPEKSGDNLPFMAATNLFTTPVEKIQPASLEIPVPPAASAEVELAGPAVIHPLTDRPLIITPQLLAEYFRPAPGTTNGAGVSVFLPVSVGFTPPTEKAPASSRATYKTE